MQRKHAKGLHDVVAVPLLELDNDNLTFNIMARLCRCHLKGLTRPLSSESPRLYLHVKHLLTLAPPLFALDACQLLELLSSDEAFAAWKQRLEQKSQLFELPPDWGELLPKLRDGLCCVR